MSKYTIGIDFGSLSGRAVLMNTENGELLASAVYEYPHAVMAEELPCGKKLPLNTALQHPRDYLEVLGNTVPAVLAQARVSAKDVAALGFDFTACTMLPVDEEGVPLCFYEEYRSEPHAYVKLWKHNSAQKEADDLNRVAREIGEPWLDIYGGKTSSEWMFPKIMQTLREAPHIYEKAARFLEAADWLVWMLTGNNICSTPFAGYKALWNDEAGYPSKEFFARLDSRMKEIIGTKISENMVSIDTVSGLLTKDGAKLTGLMEGTPLSVPVLDAHASMPALGITDEGVLMLILGTSACHIVNSKKKMNIAGLCGHVHNSVIPEMYTYEAGQACCGDHFDWFVKNCVPASYFQKAEEEGVGIHKFLREKAKKLKVGESGLLALDWFNGNRSVLSNSGLTGMLLGMTLRTKPEEIYRALIEATAYGTRIILDTFEQSGIRIDRIVASGGIAEKDEMLVQIYSDVINRPITVSDAKMSAARGSAIYATVAAGAYTDIREASKHLALTIGKSYMPIPENVKIYDRLFAEYKRLYEYFGKGENDVMKRLKDIGKMSEE